MRRALPAIGMTAAGLIMLLRFQSNPGGGAIGVSSTPTGSGATTGTTAPGSSGTTPGVTSGGGFDPGGGFGPGEDGDGGFGGRSEVPTTVPDPDASTAGGARDGTYDGAEVQTRFGPVQVQITISGGQLTDVVELEVPNDHRRSIEINDQAGPILRSEALAAQSAQLDQVSGATITWAAYEQSLQAALDAANA